LGNDLTLGFNRRKIEAERKAEADAEAASQAPIGLFAAWNERQGKHMPTLFASTIRATPKPLLIKSNDESERLHKLCVRKARPIRTDEYHIGLPEIVVVVATLNPPV
jgi:hypothetical protein